MIGYVLRDCDRVMFCGAQGSVGLVVLLLRRRLRLLAQPEQPDSVPAVALAPDWVLLRLCSVHPLPLQPAQRSVLRHQRQRRHSGQAARACLPRSVRNNVLLLSAIVTPAHFPGTFHFSLAKFPNGEIV